MQSTIPSKMKSVLSHCTFSHLVERGLLSPPVENILAEKGYDHLTEIQFHSFPLILSRTSLFLHGRTGSGKTLAFLLPTFERLKAMNFNKSCGVGLLIISPTRELAMQIGTVAAPLAATYGFEVCSIVGGKAEKSSKIQRSQIVVGTPRKLAAFVGPGGRQSLMVHKLQILVLDEMDRLLSGEFIKQMELIFKYLPIGKVQKLLASATINQNSLLLAKDLLRSEFQMVSTEEAKEETPGEIKQHYILVPAENRFGVLCQVLWTLRKKKVMVFFSSCHSVKFHYNVFKKLDLPVLRCMGRLLKQSTRTAVYSAFAAAQRGILLTTGLAERGWDIPGVRWIVQFDPPHNPKDYIHRVGRTGRGIAPTGNALLFLRPEECEYVPLLRGLNLKMQEWEFQGDVSDMQHKLRSIISSDESIAQSAKLAYKKFVRAYQVHSQKNIFNVNTLDLNKVSQSFGFQEPPVNLGKLKQ